MMKTVNRTDPFIGFLLVSKIHSDFQSNSLSLRLSAGRDCAVMSRMRVQATRRSATVPVCCCSHILSRPETNSSVDHPAEVDVTSSGPV